MKLRAIWEAVELAIDVLRGARTVIGMFRQEPPDLTTQRNAEAQRQGQAAGAAAHRASRQAGPQPTPKARKAPNGSEP